MQELTHEQIRTLADTRHAGAGVLFPPEGLQPYYDWLIRTVHTLAESAAANLRVVRDDGAPTAVRVFAGRASINGAVVAFGGTTLDLAAHNNAAVLLALALADATPMIVVSPSGEGWPTQPHVRLAAVTLADGAVSAIVDRRFESLCRVNELSADADTPPLIDHSGGDAAPPTDTPAPGTRTVPAVDSLAAAADAIATLAAYAATLRADLNDLRARLRAAGLMRV